MKERLLKHKVLITLVKALLAGLSLWYLIYYLDAEVVRRALEGADLLLIALAGALLCANIFLEGLKWHIMVKRVDPEIRPSDSFGAMMSGYALGFFTPARVGDYLARAFYLKHENKLELAAVTLAERLLTLVCYIGVGLVALVYFLLVRAEIHSFTWYLVVFVGAVSCGTLVFLALNPRIARALITFVLPFKKVREIFGFLDRFDTRDAHLLLGLSMLRYAVFATQFVLLLMAFGGGAPILHLYTGIALVYFAKSAIPSLTLADLGIREGASVYFLGAFGVAGAAAFNASFLLFCINILTPALIGLPFLFRLRLSLKSSASARPSPAAAPVPRGSNNS